MDSPCRWPSDVLEQDLLPCTSTLVAPGQEDYFLAQGQCLEGLPGQRRSDSVTASPNQLENLQPGLPPHGAYSGFLNYQDLSMPKTSSPANGAQSLTHVYQMSSLRHLQPANLAALDLATGSLSPNHATLHNSRSCMLGDSPALNQALDSGVLMYGGQHSYLGFDPASQYSGLQQQRLQTLAQHSSLQARSKAAVAAAGVGLMDDATVAIGLAPSGLFPSYYHHQQQQNHQQQLSSSPPSAVQHPHHALILRSNNSSADPSGSAMLVLSSRGAPSHQSPTLSTGTQPSGPFPRPNNSLTAGPLVEVHNQLPPSNVVSHGTMSAREGGSGAIWVGSDKVVHTALPASPTVVLRAAGGGRGISSPMSPSPVGFPAGAGATGGGDGVGDLHGANRHVVAEFRTSPRTIDPDFETPARGNAGSSRSLALASSGDKSASLQRYQAQIMALERQNAELHKRLSDAQAAVEASQQARQVLEAKQDVMADQVHQANLSAKSRENSLENARRANDALSGELKSCQEELVMARNAVGVAKDTAVQWQDRALEVRKELEAARKKIEMLGEEERRLSSENMTLRKEMQQLNEVNIKGRIEAAELREKLRISQQETARATSTAQALASQRDSEQEAAAAQLASMRNKVGELESRNSQLMYDVSGLREDVARARQAADAAKAALTSKPAGVSSDGGGGNTRHLHGLVAGHTTGWVGHEAVAQASSAAAPRGATPSSYSSGGYGGGGSLGGDVACSNGGGTAGISNGFGGGNYNGPSNGGGRSNGGSTTYGSGGGAVGRPPLPPPLPLPQGTDSFPALQPEQSTAAAILRDLPPDVEFSKLDPETFRSMVRAEAAALARGGAYGGGANSPQKSSYSSRYDDDLAAEASAGDFGGAAPPPRIAWGNPPPSRDLVAVAPPPTDVRDVWQPQTAEMRTYSGFGGGVTGGAPSTNPVARGDARAPGGGGSSGSPPPYAVNVSDNSYAYRRPANAVGTGVMPPGGGPGVMGHAGDSPYGTEETVKDMIARSKALEDQLMVLCSEKGRLEAEYARMPLGSGRSLRERDRKQVVEQRLELLNKEISSVRMKLKRLGVK